MIMERERGQSGDALTIDQEDDASCITMKVPKSFFSQGGGEIRLQYLPVTSSDSVEPDEAHDQKNEQFIETVYLLSDVDDTRRASDAIVSYFDSLIRQNKFNVCANVLSKIKVENINPTLMVAFLSITLPVKDELWARPPFYARVRKLLDEQRGPEKASRLLDKYK